MILSLIHISDSIKAAKPRLERIETDILNNFKRLGVTARTLDGKERLSQLHAVFHMDEQLPFQFEWNWLAPSGPVSYTHLDVYKRQLFIHVEYRMKLGKPFPTVQCSGGYAKTLEVIEYIGLNTLQTGLGGFDAVSVDTKGQVFGLDETVVFLIRMYFFFC